MKFFMKFFPLLLVAAFAGAGAGAALAQTPDAAMPDAAMPDATKPDAATPDAAMPDAPALEALPPAPKSAATSDAFVWKIQPPVGARFQMRTFSRMKQTLATPVINGEPSQQVKIDVLSRLVADYDVMSRDSFGGTTVRLTLRDLSSSATTRAGGKTLVIAPDAQARKAVDGASYSVKMAPDGTVWNVVGFENFQNKLLGAQGLTPAAQAQMRQMMGSMFSKEAMTKMMRNMTGGALPNYPVRVGETWKYNADLPAGTPFQFQLSGTRTLKALDETTASVGEQMSFGGAQLNLKAPQGEVSIDMSGLTGTYNGVTRVDRASGLPLETTLQFSFSGDIKMSAPDFKSAPQTIVMPIQMTGTTRMVMEPR